MADPSTSTLSPRKIYLKDASFESPGAPGVFLGEAVNPKIDLNINVLSQQIDPDGRFFEVVLHVTATATQDEKSLFLVEVQQAGIFEINAEDDKHKQVLIHVGCGHMLLPFAREEVANLVTKGGYPQLLISPINFESVYRQRLEAAEKGEAAESNGEETPPGVH